MSTAFEPSSPDDAEARVGVLGRWSGLGVRSLYLSIYLTVVAVLLVFALVAALLVRRHTDAERGRIEMAVSDRTLALIGLLQNSLPPVTAPQQEQREALLEWSRRLRLPLAMDDAAGQRIAASPLYERQVGRDRHQESKRASPVALVDQRIVWVLRPDVDHHGIRPGDLSDRDVPPWARKDFPRPAGIEPHRLDRGGPGAVPLGEVWPPRGRIGGRDGPSGPVFHRHEWPDWRGLRLDQDWLDDASVLLFLLAALFVAITVGAYPVVRRLTRRLESLEQGVEQFGQGDLGFRLDERGRDEVAAVAASFNRAAQRIEDLVRSNRSLLANASHEFRSPLARLKMAVSMMDSVPEPQRQVFKDEISRDIRELNELVEEVMLASRLDAQVDLRTELVDLLGLLVEEGARVGIAADGEPVQVLGEERLLRRAVRNLLENACRYGGGEVEASLVPVGVDSMDVLVCDRGPGVPAEFRERIFEPFFRLPGHAEQAGGMGLGLSLVRQIAARHGGSVRCQPREGGGSCFVIRLPRSWAVEAQPVAPAPRNG